MRGLREMSRFRLLNRKLPFLIDPSPLGRHYLNYTYLQSHIDYLTEELDYQERPSYTHTHFRNLQNNKNFLLQLNQQQILESHLEHKCLKDISKGFKNCRTSLSEAIDQLISNHFNKSAEVGMQLISIAETAIILNILDITLWNKLLFVFCKYYEGIDKFDQQNFFLIFLNYLQKFQYGAENYPFKFIYRENILKDLINFNFFLQSVFPFEKNSGKITLKGFQRQIKIIRKASKAVDINFIILRKQFKKYQRFIIDHLELMSATSILELYNFSTSILSQCPELIEKMDEGLLPKLKKEQSSDNLFNLVKILTDIWKNQSRYNEKLYREFVNPILLTNLAELKNTNPINNQMKYIWKSIAYNLLCAYSNQKDAELIQDIVKTLQEKKVYTDKTLHFIKHYFLLKKLHKQGLDIVKNAQLDECKKYQRQIIEFSGVEEFWHFAIKQVIPPEHVHKSKYVCILQIDILVNYRGRAFAFEIQGAHYNRDNSNELAGEEILTGKKKIKEQILTMLGIKTIKILCGSPQLKLMMRFKNLHRAKQYISKLLEQKFQEVDQKRSQKQA